MIPFLRKFLAFLLISFLIYSVFGFEFEETAILARYRRQKKYNWMRHWGMHDKA